MNSIPADDFVGRPGVFPDNLIQNIPNGGVILSEVINQISSAQLYHRKNLSVITYRQEFRTHFFVKVCVLIDGVP